MLPFSSIVYLTAENRTFRFNWLLVITNNNYYYVSIRYVKCVVKPNFEIVIKYLNVSIDLNVARSVNKFDLYFISQDKILSSRSTLGFKHKIKILPFITLCSSRRLEKKKNF